MTRPGRGEFYAVLAAIGYGSAYVATAFALRSFQPLPIAVYRTFLGAIGLVILIAATRRAEPAAPPTARASLTVRALHLVVISACGGPLFLTGMNLAIAGVGATIASFVAGLYAVLAAVFAPVLLREPLRPRALAGFIVALIGTAFLAELDLGGSGIGGIAWGLEAAVSFALFLVLSRKWSRADGFDGLTVALGTMTATTLAVGLVVLATQPAAFAPTNLVPEAVIAIAWLALVAAGGQALAVMSTHRVAASRTAAFLLLNPVTAMILSFVLLGERVQEIQVLGAALVLAGMAAATIERGPSRVLAAPSAQGR
jgi:drug/metabolite transporter (DMT)-like permease